MGEFLRGNAKSRKNFLWVTGSRGPALRDALSSVVKRVSCGNVVSYLEKTWTGGLKARSTTWTLQVSNRDQQPGRRVQVLKGTSESAGES